MQHEKIQHLPYLHRVRDTRTACERDPRIGKSLSGQEKWKARSPRGVSRFGGGLVTNSPAPIGVCRFGARPIFYFKIQSVRGCQNMA